MTQKLLNALPSSLDRYFFSVGGSLVEDWQSLVCNSIEARGREEWSARQVAGMTVFCRSAAAVSWANNYLTFPHWVSPLNAFEASLAEELLEALLENHQSSQHYLFLAQAGLIASLNRVQLVRRELLLSTLDPETRRAHLSTKLERLQNNSLFFRGGSPFTIPLPNRPTTMSDVWALIYQLFSTPDSNWSSTWAGYYLKALPRFSAPSFVDAMTSDLLTNLCLKAAQATFKLFRGKALVTTMKLLREHLSNTDDWTQLIAIDLLLTLGGGTYRTMF